MKNLLNQNILLKYLFYISLFIAFSVIIVQLIMVANKVEVTSSENILLNILLFLSSISFSGIFSYMGAVHSFKQSQKDFAFSAFRRIKEIESTVITLDNAVSKVKEAGLNNSSIEALEIITLFLQRTIKSSIDDWSQLIGSEIETIKNIEDMEVRLKELEGLKDLISSKNETEEEKSNQINDEIKSLVQQIELLKNQLPSSLRYSQTLSDKQIEELIEKIKTPFMYSSANRKAIVEDFTKRLAQKTIRLQIQVSGEFLEDFVKLEPPTYTVGEVLMLKKDKNNFYYLENERGQKARFTGTGLPGNKVRKMIDDVFINMNIEPVDLKAIVESWFPKEMKGEVILVYPEASN